MAHPEHDSDPLPLADTRHFPFTAIAVLRVHHPAWIRAHRHENMVSFVERGIRQAQQYGLRTKRQVMRFLHSAVLVGDGIEPDSAHRDLIRILTRRSLSADERSEALVTAAMRTQARRHAAAVSESVEADG